MSELKVGVVGYCPPSTFDKTEADRMISEAYDQIERDHPEADSFACVSGLYDVGVLLHIAYEESWRRGWRLVGFTATVAKPYGQPLYTIDEEIIVGDQWGEDSDAFVQYIDVLVRIGLGPQSLREASACKEAGKRTYEYDLPKTN